MLQTINRSAVIILSALLFFTANAFASDHVLVAPKCLLKHAAFSYNTLSTTHSLSLIQTNEAGVDQLIKLKNNKHKPCGGFMDVTEAWQATKSVHSDANAFLTSYDTPIQHNLKNKSSYQIRYQSQVNQLLSQLNPQAMWGNLTTLTNFPDRYSRGDNGVKAAEWFKATMEKLANDTGHHDDVTAYYIQTPGYKQPSVVVQFGHLNENKSGVVIGAHMDTMSSAWEKKPGADDDGSGSVVVLEAARTLLSSGMQFQQPIYFVWYAAEEQGLVGSQKVVKEFKKLNIPVKAVMHFDCTGYAYHNESTMWVMDDYTNQDLTTYMTQLISTYVKKPVKHSRCGYACSDHASWTQAGYPATIPAEAAYEHSNPYMHSSNDTMEKLSLEHMTDYAKLAVATAVELAEPNTK